MARLLQLGVPVRPVWAALRTGDEAGEVVHLVVVAARPFLDQVGRALVARAISALQELGVQAGGAACVQRQIDRRQGKTLS
eukprot:SAG22_NODE_130_length_18670_cov_12.091379_5_plen_81_part_00